jgi:alpha/beta superfamily hydrolase
MNPMPRRIETHLLDGPAGKLEALLEAPEDTTPRAAALVCHPHPLFGGTMPSAAPPQRL